MDTAWWADAATGWQQEIPRVTPVMSHSLIQKKDMRKTSTISKKRRAVGESRGLHQYLLLDYGVYELLQFSVERDV